MGLSLGASCCGGAVASSQLFTSFAVFVSVPVQYLAARSRHRSVLPAALVLFLMGLVPLHTPSQRFSLAPSALTRARLTRSYVL